MFFLVSGLAWAAPTGRIQGSAPQPVAIYQVDENSKAQLSSRRLLPHGQFALEALPPGRYRIESPPACLPGDYPEVDRIFADGGCVFLGLSRSQLVEVVAGQTTQVEFP